QDTDAVARNWRNDVGGPPNRRTASAPRHGFISMSNVRGANGPPAWSLSRGSGQRRSFIASSGVESNSSVSEAPLLFCRAPARARSQRTGDACLDAQAVIRVGEGLHQNEVAYCRP